jgi:ABC-type amino acid transport substrate-binding protein
MLTKARTLALSILMCVAAACVPAAPSTTQQVVQYDPTKTTMGQIQKRGTLVIGVPDDFYPFGYVGAPPGPGSSAKTSTSKKPAGFTVALGKLVANALGVKATYLPLPSAQLLGAVDKNRADLVFPMVPITEAGLSAHPFTDPYFIAHQRLLVPQGSTLRNVRDLNGRSVCSAIDPNTEIPLNRLVPSISLLSVGSALRCLGPLRAKKVVAATAPDAALMGLRALLPASQIVGDQLTTEGYGAAVSACNALFAEFVTRVFSDTKASGQWSALYNRWVGPASGSGPAPIAPSMTVVDASDLFPSTTGKPSHPTVTCHTPSG